MKKQYRIVIAEDQTILPEALRALLCADPDFDIVGEAEVGRVALQGVETLSSDLFLIDLSMPNS